MLGCGLALHLLALNAVAQTEILQVKVTGNRFVSEQKILRVVRLKPGDRYSAQSVSEALKRLYATKEFADVAAVREASGSGVVVTFRVREFPRVDEVRFDGNRKIKKEELEEKTAVKAGAFVRPALLRRDFTTIEDMYREKGYYRVEVKSEIVTQQDKKTKKAATVLVYRIAEGQKVSIHHIDCFGNQALDSKQIRKAMDSKQDGWLSSPEFKPKVLEEDRDRIVRLYRSQGFLDVEIDEPELVFSDDGKKLDIFLTIREGTQYKAGIMTWSGNKIFPDRRIAPLITLHTGDVFDDVHFAEVLLQNLGALYWDEGYIYNSISPNKKVKGDVINVHFEITEGEPAHIHEINIAGNTKTSETVIRRQLVVHPGDVFRRALVIRSLREVFNLGFFNAPPDVGTKPRDNGDLDITLTVEEKQTGQFRLGAGFSQLNRISGFIGLAETNFLGKGLQVGIDWEFSKTRQTVDLRFTEPWLFGTPTQLSLNVYNRVQGQVSQQFYDDQRRGASIRLGRPFPWFDYTSMFWRYSWESIKLSNFSPFYQGPLRLTVWPQVTSSMSFTLLRNSTDSPFRPTAGTRSTVTASFNGGVLGGDVTFQAYEGAFSLYQSIIRSLVLEVRFGAGVLQDSGPGGGVPDYELYRLGGNRRFGVRGYDFYAIVPKGNPLYLGGRFYEIMAYELTLPLASNIFLLGFLDAGNTWNTFGESDVFDLRKGVGVGIRMELPMLGILGFDYGYGYDKPGGGSWIPHLNLGGSF
jgi:outer membrane protein insertion porin family